MTFPDDGDTLPPVLDSTCKTDDAFGPTAIVDSGPFLQEPIVVPNRRIYRNWIDTESERDTETGCCSGDGNEVPLTFESDPSDESSESSDESSDESSESELAAAGAAGAVAALAAFAGAGAGAAGVAAGAAAFAGAAGAAVFLASGSVAGFFVTGAGGCVAFSPAFGLRGCTLPGRARIVPRIDSQKPPHPGWGPAQPRSANLSTYPQAP